MKVSDSGREKPPQFMFTLLTGGRLCKLGLTIVRPNLLSAPETLGNWWSAACHVGTGDRHVFLFRLTIFLASLALPASCEPVRSFHGTFLHYNLGMLLIGKTLCYYTGWSKKPHNQIRLKKSQHNFGPKPSHLAVSYLQQLSIFLPKITQICGLSQTLPALRSCILIFTRATLC